MKLCQLPGNGQPPFRQATALVPNEYAMMLLSMLGSLSKHRIAPPSVNVEVDLRQWNLAALDPYLDEFANVRVLGSELTFAERYSTWVYDRRGRGGSGDGPEYSLDREIEDLQAVHIPLPESNGNAMTSGHPPYRGQ